MANYPPPSPPPPGSQGPGQPPYGFDPRMQARIAREQARIQRQAFKAQRDVYKAQRYMVRQQLRSARRRSLLGPLLILAIGITLLVARTRNVSAVWALEIYSHWWPLLFVFAGIVLLAEWTVDQIVAHQHPDAPVLGRRSFGGGVVVLLILLSIAGGLAMAARNHAQNLMADFGGNGDSLAMFLGDKHEVDQTLDLTFPAGGTLSIDNPHGDVTIAGDSKDGKIHITEHKEIYSQSDSEADRRAQDMNPQVVTDGGQVSLKVPAFDGASADLTINLPESAAVNVTANHGDVRITDLLSGATVIANHGDVELSAITGDVSTRVNRSDATFSAHNITGNVSLRGLCQDLTVLDIVGQVSLEGDFYGTTHLEQIKGGVRFHTSRTDFQVARLDGEVEISPDASLTVDHAAGPALLKTTNRNITMDRIDGDISVTNTNGTVDITGAPPLGDITVQNRKGAVDVTMPAHAGFNVQADATDGGIDNEFGLPDVDSDHKASMSGVVGPGGPRVHITTTHGDISIRKAEIAPLPATPPAPPAPPAEPAKPAKPAPHAPKAPKTPTPPKEITF